MDSRDDKMVIVRSIVVLAEGRGKRGVVKEDRDTKGIRRMYHI
jgi:hypothetical protein